MIFIGATSAAVNTELGIVNLSEAGDLQVGEDVNAVVGDADLTGGSEVNRHGNEMIAFELFTVGAVKGTMTHDLAAPDNVDGRIVEAAVVPGIENDTETTADAAF